jgi:hypothetical protein
VDNTVDPGATTVKYNQFDMTGLARVIASYADDLPRAQIKGKEFRQALKSLGVEFGYNLQEIREARFAGLPLEARQAMASMRAMEEKIDAIGSLGSSADGLNGFLALANANTYTVPNGASTHPDWARKTGLEMLADLSGIAVVSVDLTNNVEVPDTIILPIAQYNRAANTPLMSSVGGVTTTVLRHFLDNNPFVKNVESWYRCKGAGANATDRMVAYRKDPEALQLVIPQEYEQLPIEVRGLEFNVACHARIGGVVAYYPLSVTYGDGI